MSDPLRDIPTVDPATLPPAIQAIIAEGPRATTVQELSQIVDQPRGTNFTTDSAQGWHAVADLTRLCMDTSADREGLRQHFRALVIRLGDKLFPDVSPSERMRRVGNMTVIEFRDAIKANGVDAAAAEKLEQSEPSVTLTE